MRNRYSEKDKEKVLNYFKTKKENSEKTISEKLGYNINFVSKAITDYLNEKINFINKLHNAK